MNHCKHIPLFLLLFAFVIAAQGCLSAKKVNKLVTLYHEDDVPEIKKTDYLSFVYDSSNAGKHVAHTKKLKKTFLPFIVYYRWNYQFHSEVNDIYLLSNLSNKVIAYADSVELKKKLNGGTLLLTVNTNPENLDLTYGGNIIYWFIGASIYGVNLHVEPSNQFISVSYQVLQEGKKAKKRTIKIKNPGERIDAKSLDDKPSMIVGDYLSKVENRMKIVSKAIVDQIMKEL